MHAYNSLQSLLLCDWKTSEVSEKMWKEFLSLSSLFQTFMCIRPWNSSKTSVISSFILQTLNKLKCDLAETKALHVAQPKNRPQNHLPLFTGPKFSFLLNLAISYSKAIQNIHINMLAGYYLPFWPWGVATMPIWGMKILQGLISCTEATAHQNGCIHTWNSFLFSIHWWPPVSLLAVLGGPCLWPHWWLNSVGNQMTWPVSLLILMLPVTHIQADKHRRSWWALTINIANDALCFDR